MLTVSKSQQLLKTAGVLTGAGIGGAAGFGLAGLAALLSKHRAERIAASTDMSVFTNRALNETVNHAITGGLAGAGLGGVAGAVSSRRQKDKEKTAHTAKLAFDTAIQHDGTDPQDPSIAMSWDDVQGYPHGDNLIDLATKRQLIMQLMGIPNTASQPQHFAEDMAAPVKAAAVKLNPVNRVASKPRARSNFQTPPAIGQPKTGPLVPPATQDAGKMIMRSAPSVPNPIVPPAQSGVAMPTQKTAGSYVTAVAPRYTSGGKKGKKAMPQPHARQLKKAAAMTPVEFGQLMAGHEKRADELTLPIAAGALAASTGIGAGVGYGMHGLARLLGPKGAPDEEIRKNRNQLLISGAGSGAGVALGSLLREYLRSRGHDSQRSATASNMAAP